MSNDLKFLLLLLFFFFSSSSSFNDGIHKCFKEQRDALLLFKQSLSSINNSQEQFYACLYLDYPILMNWNTSIDCCKWDGVTCNPFTGDVIGLDLSCGMLQGTIHPNTTLFHLPHLQRLNLAYNNLTGQLPHRIAEFSNSLTHLNISQCRFTGQIPSEISFLPKLVSLDLFWNSDLSLDPHVFNNLLRNSSGLKELVLGGVNISSVLPIHLNISSSLKRLDLRLTSMTGKLPDNIFNLPYLEELDLSNNEFTGQNPLEISSLSKLVSLYLSGNRFPLQIQPDALNNLLHNSTCLRDLGLGGVKIGLVLPPHLNITSFRSLQLSSTGLQGKLPDNIFHLPYLEKLDLSGNIGITGSLPNVNRSISSPLKSLDLSSTNLSPGEIPDSFGHLKSLISLDLSQCNLIGSLPNSLVNLRYVSWLDLTGNKLNGTLPSWLFTLPSLKVILLGENMFSGNLPLELFASQALRHIYLHDNQLDGQVDQVPNTLQTSRQLINLVGLDLSFNNLKGVWELDTLLSILPNLQLLDLSYSGLSVTTNNATGYVSDIGMVSLGLASCKLTVVPEYLRGMKNLATLDLSNNEIEGHIPDWAVEIGGNRLRFLNLSHNYITGLPQFQWRELRFIHLGSNHIHGPIPNVYRHCGQLEGLVLNGNQFQGEVPVSLSRCRSLKVLDLGNNYFNGTFPSWLQNLPNLQVLDLKSNNFHGPIVALSQVKVEHPFPSLKVLDLSNNRFVGHLPKIYFQNFNAMKDAVSKGAEPKYLNASGLYYSIIVVWKGVEQNFQQILVDYIIVDLSNNNFEGQIPNAIGNLNSLKMLNLSHNNFTGRIPHAIGNLGQIESLDLSFNQLTGEIPQSLADLTFLACLNLSQNHLVGRIPLGKQFNTFEGNSFGGNQGLCGFPLSNMCEQPHKPHPKADEVDEECGFTWRLVALGYGCGTLLGLVMGYLMLSTGKPKWFNAIVDAVECKIHATQKKMR